MNGNKPYIDIIVEDDKCCGYSGIIHSLEENGIPFRTLHMKTGAVESSVLGITVYVKSDCIEVYYEKYDDMIPVLKMQLQDGDTCDIIYQRARKTGNNIANLINVRRLEK